MSTTTSVSTWPTCGRHSAPAAAASGCMDFFHLLQCAPRFTGGHPVRFTGGHPARFTGGHPARFTGAPLRSHGLRAAPACDVQLEPGGCGAAARLGWRSAPPFPSRAPLHFCIAPTLSCPQLMAAGWSPLPGIGGLSRRPPMPELRCLACLIPTYQMPLSPNRFAAYQLRLLYIAL